MGSLNKRILGLCNAWDWEQWMGRLRKKNCIFDIQIQIMMIVVMTGENKI